MTRKRKPTVSTYFNWLDINKVGNWPSAFFNGFQYDDITDEQITIALADPALVNVDVLSEWEDDDWLRDHQTIPEDMKHAYRVAALVVTLRNGDGIRNAIQIDTFAFSRCRSGVYDGHHRIRALQYLQVNIAPFGLSGNLDELEELVGIAGVDDPSSVQHVFNSRFFAA